MAEPTKLVEPFATVEPGDTSISSFQLKINTERLDEDVSVLVICCCLIDPQEWEIRIDPAMDMDNGLTLRELQIITASVTKFIRQVSSMVFEINNFQEVINESKNTLKFRQ